jgi:hypothetical protein
MRRDARLNHGRQQGTLIAFHRGRSSAFAAFGQTTARRE